MLKHDINIPFDAGYAAIFIRPTFDMELPQEHELASEVKDSKDDKGPPWQLVKKKKNKKMHINQNTHVKQVTSPNITKRHGDNCQKINKCGMHICGWTSRTHMTFATSPMLVSRGMKECSQVQVCTGVQEKACMSQGTHRKCNGHERNNVV